MAVAHYGLRGDTGGTLWQGDKLCAYCKTGWETSMPKVGVCLKHLPPPSTDQSKNPAFHSSNVPWQRVINSKGGISPRGPGAASKQADALRREGVEVSEDSMGQYTVDFKDYGWFPDVLPSEAGIAESSDEEDEAAANHA